MSPQLGFFPYRTPHTASPGDRWNFVRANVQIDLLSCQRQSCGQLHHDRVDVENASTCSKSLGEVDSVKSFGVFHSIS